MSELYKDLPHTAFPNSVDTMTSFKNINAEDISSVNMFQYYLRMGDFAAAESILDSIPDVANKMIDSNKLNKLRDALIALERYYKSDIKTYITGKQNEWQGIMDEFTYAGVWSSSKAYDKNNIVQHTIGSETYMYIAAKDVPVNTQISNVNYWTLFTIRGQRGESGQNGAFRYDYDAATTYSIGDIVSYDNCLWAAKTETTNHTPSETDTTNWELLIKMPTVSAPMQSAQPTNAVEGDIWFQTI